MDLDDPVRRFVYNIGHKTVMVSRQVDERCYTLVFSDWKSLGCLLDQSGAGNERRMYCFQGYVAFWLKNVPA